MTPDATINWPICRSASPNAAGTTACDPTWKVMPSRRAIWRARSSSAGASSLDTPNLPSSGIRLWVLGQATRRKSVEVVGSAGLGHDLVELLVAVEGEAADAEIAIGAHDRAARLHRIHEVELGIGNARHALDLDQRGHIEGADAGLDQRLDDCGRVVGFRGIEHAAGEIGEEPVRRATRGMRP